MHALILPIVLLIIHSIYLKYKKTREKVEMLERRKLQEELAENQIRKAKIEKEEEKQKKVNAYREKLKESYFIFDQWENENKEPFTLEQIKDFLKKGELTLNSKIKYGYNSHDFMPIHDYKEFNQKFKDFL